MIGYRPGDDAPANSAAIWSLGIVALAIALVLLPPLLIGHYAQRDVERLVVRSSQGPVQLRLQSYQRSLFRAEGVIEIRRPGESPIVVSLDVRHGPLLPRSSCGDTLGLAVASGEILPAEANTELVRLFGRDPLPVLCAYSDLSGDGVVEFTLPAHAATTLLATGEQYEFAWARTVLQVYEIQHGARLVLNAPRIEVSALFEVDEIAPGRPVYGQWDHRLDGVTLHQTVVSGGGDLHADTELAIATLNATRTVYEPEAFGELQGLVLRSQTAKHAGIVDWSGRVAWNAMLVPSWHVSAGEIPMQLLNIDAVALSEIEAAPNPSLRADAFRRLIGAGPVFRLGPASQHSQRGDLALDVAALIHPGPISPDTEASQLLQRLEGRFDLSLPTGMIYAMVRERYEDEIAHESVARGNRVTPFQLARLAEGRFDADIARVADRGLVRREGDRLLLDLTLSGGLIQSYGREEPLLDLIEWFGLLLRASVDEVEA